MILTSGSTAHPKIAVLSFANLLANAVSAITLFDLRPGDLWLLNLPLYHVGGVGILLRCFYAEADIVLDAKNPNITHVSAIPTQLYRATPIYKNLRCLLIGGAPIASYPKKLPCFLTYGLTEMASLVTARLSPPQIEGHFYLGAPLQGREIKIAGDGEILVQGDCLFQGYWEYGKIHLPRDSEGWFATGDIGRYGPEGLAILGRKDWQFISGGENIQPEEIERELLLLPEILEAAVIGVPHPEYGHCPIAVCHSSDPAFNTHQMKNALLHRLPNFKIPYALYLVEELPKKGLKIDRNALLEFIKNIPVV